MTKVQRAFGIITGLAMIIGSVLITTIRDDGYQIILTLLSITLILAGVRTLVYYFSMARHMVGGNALLYKGAILLDFGIVSGSLAYVPHVYIMLYLLGIHLFSGIVEVMRAMEAKHYHGASWKLKFSHGVVNIIIAIVCAVFINSVDFAVYIYGIGLAYSGIVRIITALRKGAIVYIH